MVNSHSQQTIWVLPLLPVWLSPSSIHYSHLGVSWLFFPSFQLAFISHIIMWSAAYKRYAALVIAELFCVHLQFEGWSCGNILEKVGIVHSCVCVRDCTCHHLFTYFSWNTHISWRCIPDFKKQIQCQATSSEKEMTQELVIYLVQIPWCLRRKERIRDSFIRVGMMCQHTDIVQIQEWSHECRTGYGPKRPDFPIPMEPCL